MAALTDSVCVAESNVILPNHRKLYMAIRAVGDLEEHNSATDAELLVRGVVKIALSERALSAWYAAAGRDINGTVSTRLTFVIYMSPQLH